MAKTEYNKPEIIIEKYEPTDVITTSDNEPDLHSPDEYNYGG